MTRRSPDVEALLARSRNDLTRIEAEYNDSLRAQTIAPKLRIDIKNLLGNLRSVLDYLAQDIRESFCPPAKPKERFYFPILPDKATFDSQLDQWLPGLRAASPDLTAYLETIQPYLSGKEWLGHFNTVNNESKHNHLVEQTRTEYAQTRVTGAGGGQVTWLSGVTFGLGVSVMGVPIDPRTQLPVPDPSIRVERITWVDFRLAGIDVSALFLLKASEGGIGEIA